MVYYIKLSEFTYRGYSIYVKWVYLQGKRNFLTFIFPSLVVRDQLFKERFSFSFFYLSL